VEALLKNPLVGEQPRSWFEPARIGLGASPSARSLERQVLALENRAPGTYGHSHRVGTYAAELARDAGLSRTVVKRVRRAGALHDIGKTKVPGEILNKRGPLTVQEFVIVSRHAQIGAAMVAGLGDPELTAIVRHHHESFDGTGYPDGLIGEEIPLGARIVAVCDAFDALTTNRPYRAAIGYPEALEVLGEEAGGQLDPTLVGLFQERFAGVWAAA
jgi:putative nucleotidyltransferase with HDIG domain